MLIAEDGYRFAEKRNHVYHSMIAFLTCALLVFFAAGSASGVPRYLILGASVVPTAWAVRRSFRIELLLSGQGAVVRNYWRTFEFDWIEVSDVDVALLTSGIVPQRVIAFTLRDGRLARAQATATSRSKRAMLFGRIEEFAPNTVKLHRA